MCFGRFVFGLSSGVLLCATPKYLDEVVPSRLIDKGFGTSTNIIINLAVMIILLMATGLPDDPVDLQATYYWYLIYAFQIPFQLLAIFLHSYVYTEEPIDFCIKNGKTDEALKLISKIYSNETPEMQREFYQAKLEQHQSTIMQ